MLKSHPLLGGRGGVRYILQKASHGLESNRQRSVCGAGREIPLGFVFQWHLRSFDQDRTSRSEHGSRPMFDRRYLTKEFVWLDA